MKKALFLAVLSCLTLALSALAQAPPPPGDPAGPPPELILKDFLTLTDAQVTALGALLDTRNQAVQTILPQLDSAEKALGDALKEPSPDPAQLGSLLLVVHGLRGQIRSAERAAVEGFRSLLTADQLAKVDQAAALMKVLPALDALHHLHLLAPPEGGTTGGVPRGFPPPTPAPSRVLSR